MALLETWQDVLNRGIYEAPTPHESIFGSQRLPEPCFGDDTNNNLLERMSDPSPQDCYCLAHGLVTEDPCDTWARKQDGMKNEVVGLLFWM